MKHTIYIRELERKRCQQIELQCFAQEFVTIALWHFLANVSRDVFRKHIHVVVTSVTLLEHTENKSDSRRSGKSIRHFTGMQCEKYCGATMRM